MPPLFEAKAPEDNQIRDRIARARACGRNKLDADGEIKRWLVLGHAAQSVKSPLVAAAARAVGLASAVAHMVAHVLGAATYAAKTASLAAVDQKTAPHDEACWQIDQFTPDLRAALARLPMLGENSSGPLGSGHLASGVLAEAIREIPPELSCRSSQTDPSEPKTSSCKWRCSSGRALRTTPTQDE